VRLFGRKPKDEPADINERARELGLRPDDMFVLDQLVKNGTDLQASRQVRSYSHAPSKEVAWAGPASSHLTCLERPPREHHPLESAGEVRHQRQREEGEDQVRRSQRGRQVQGQVQGKSMSGTWTSPQGGGSWSATKSS
jgi:hypothetical protein